MRRFATVAVAQLLWVSGFIPLACSKDTAPSLTGAGGATAGPATGGRTSGGTGGSLATGGGGGAATGGGLGTGGIIVATGGTATGGTTVGSGGQGAGGDTTSGGVTGSGGAAGGAVTGGAPGSGGRATGGNMTSATGGNRGLGGSAAGGAPSPDAGVGGGSGDGGRSTGNGGAGAGGATGAAGAGGSTTAGTGVPSAGCGKTSTLTFTTVPGESASAAAGSGNTVGHGDGGYVTITSAGQNRGFALRLPDNYDKNKPYWLIFGFHWNGGNSSQVDNGGTNGYWWAYYGLQRKSNNNAIFVAPDGISAGWANTGGRDLQFVDDMVKLIEDNYCVDTSNLITSGFSYGGGMSYELACARAKVFRAAVIYEGGQLSGCDGGNDPIALWQVEGLTDTTVNMGLATPIRDRFVKNNGCTAQTPPQPANPPPYVNPGGHLCTDYAGCSAGHPVRWCVSQSGHGPGPIDGTSDLYNSCATPPKSCSASCPCTWTPDDVWPWLNGQTITGQTPNATK